MPTDQPFIHSLFAASRPELQWIDGEEEFVQAIVDMQYQAQTQGYGEQNPNAMYFIIERLGERIGRVTLDFSNDRVHLVDLVFIPQAQGQGHGGAVINAIQRTAARIKAPVTLAVPHNRQHAKHLYLKMGFQVEGTLPMHDTMIWYPTAEAMRGI